jgi:rhamnogalacturonyl hydrolase YesR
MKSLFYLAIAICLTFTLNAQKLPYKHRVLEKMVLANKYFMNKWPDPTAAIVTDKSRPSNLWTRAAYYEGLMQLYYISRDTALYKYALDWGTFHKWEPTYGGTTATDADFICCTQTYIELYLLDTTKKERIAKIKSNADYLINSTKSNYWWWIDALQMGMPVFAKLGAIYKDNKYFNALYRFYSFPRFQSKGVGLYNATDKFWYRDSSFLPPKTTTNGLPVYWSRGEGWVITALARVLDVMPVNAPYRNEYLTMYQNIASAALPIQRTDGFWNPSLSDTNDYGGKETSGTAMFTFALAWGVNHGILDSTTYYPVILKAWNGMVQYALHTNGMLGYVQGTGKQPSDAQPLSYDKIPNFEDYGLGAFLLAGSEVYRLAPDSVGAVTSVAELNSYNEKTSLYAYPNPSFGNLNISYTCVKGDVEISLYDLFGRKVSTLLSTKNQKPGSYNITWNIADDQVLKSGIFILKLRNGEIISELKLKLQ